MGQTTETQGPSLEQLRFRKLVRALHNNGTGKTRKAIAAELGCDFQLISDVIDAKDHVSHELVERAAEVFGVHPDYFSKADLGEFTTHEHFVGGSPFAKASAETTES